MTKKLLIVITNPDFFLSHRKEIALEAKSQGYEVHLCTMNKPSVAEIKSLGFIHHNWRIARTGTNPLSEFLAILSLWRVFWTVRPDIVHLVTIKAVLYGGILARLSPVKGVVTAISGLGFVFSSQKLKARILRSVLKYFYAFALGHSNQKIIFQNPDDRELLYHVTGFDLTKVEMIRGSGVNLEKFTPKPESEGDIVFTFAARLLWDKGIGEFIDAANSLVGQDLPVRFLVVGEPDSLNPESVKDEHIKRWAMQPRISFLGHKSAEEMPEIFAKSHVVVLPSYREGLPKVLLEAQASGRPVITTDVPGCRDAIEEGKTGLLCPVRDASILAVQMRKLIEKPELRREMGQNARKLAEEVFGVEKVVEQHLNIYSKILLT